MSTKFIGVDGFNEIESINTPHQKRKKLSTLKKVVRFAKRASKAIFAFIYKSALSFSSNLKKLISKISNNSLFSSSSAKPVKSVSFIDKCYQAERNGNNENNREYKSSLKNVFNSLSSSNNKYAHISNEKTQSAMSDKSQNSENAPRRVLLGKKAFLSVLATFTAITLSCITVANALGVSNNSLYAATCDETSKTKSVQQTKNIPSETINSNLYSATADEISTNARLSVTAAMLNDNINTACCCLYLDGNLVGITSDCQALKDGLQNLLDEYKKGYDDTTEVSFVNNVEIKNADNTDDTDVQTATELIDSIKNKLSYSLSTDMYYETDVDYETKYKEDDSKPTSYSKTLTEGKKGKAKVTIRTTFVDGVQTDAVETESNILSKPTDKVVVKGTKEETSYSSSAETDTSNDSSVSSSSSGSFMWPVPYTSNITSYYEYRWGRMHWGIDISSGGIYGQGIVASDSGTVTYAGNDGSGYGNYVIVDHGNGYSTLYGHCSSLAVSNGQSVSKGQTIAYVGSTGNSTGPHLHFEVRQGTEKLNPLNYVG